MKKAYLLWTSLVVAGFVLSACGGGGGGGVTGPFTPLTPTDAAKAGTFAAIDNPAAPALGLFAAVTVNPTNTGFVVAGKAVNAQGAAWTLAGTMTRDGVVQMSGTGLAPAPGAAAPANMTVSGTMSGDQIVATVNLDAPVAVTFEKAVTLTNPAMVGRFMLATDPGISTPGSQEQHAAASLTVQADGRISAAFVQSGVKDINDPLLVVASNRFARIDGILLNDGRILGVGGGNAGANGDPGSGQAIVPREPLDFPSGVILMGTMALTPPVQAAVTVRCPTLPGIVALAAPLTLVPATNPLAGIFSGTNTDASPVEQPATNPVVMGVNEDGTVAGYLRFALKPDPDPTKTRPFTESLFVGKVLAGVLVPDVIPVQDPALQPSGLVLMDDEGSVLTAGVSGTASGTIVAGTNPTSGITTAIADGAWQFSAGALPFEPFGIFRATRLP